MNLCLSLIFKKGQDCDGESSLGRGKSIEVIGDPNWLLFFFLSGKSEEKLKWSVLLAEWLKHSMPGKRRMGGGLRKAKRRHQNKGLQKERKVENKARASS